MNSNRFGFSSTFRKPLRPSKQFDFAKKRAFFISIHKRKKLKREKLISQLVTSKRKSSASDEDQATSQAQINIKAEHFTPKRKRGSTYELNNSFQTLQNHKGKDTVGKNPKKSQKQSSPKKKDQGHHFRCLPKTVASMYNECLRGDAQKMALIEELGFGAFSHLPNYNLKQHMLKELVNIFNIHDNTIHSVRGDVEITTNKIGKALGLSWNGEPFDDKVSEKDLSDEDHAIFKLRRNWALHVHDFLLEELKKAKLNNTNAIHGCCYVMMIIYFHETHFGKDAREPKAQPLWIQFWTGENLLKRLNREQNHPTGLVKTGLLRIANDKLLKRNMELKMGISLMRKYPYSSESESEYDSQVESSSGGSSSSLSEEDSENTKSEELVERGLLLDPTPAQGERRSKKKQDSTAIGGLRNEAPPLVERALGKRKQPERAAKSKHPNQGKPTPDDPDNFHIGNDEKTPQPQRRPRRRLIKLVDKIGHANASEL
ncbi:hypothetical protein PIB30_010518 [Stylosanthes scabra]|uniref:Uncharacterized protein n=1 Tax=Stylosanthes scabra TaxID=79078 RepID=A0ABU6Q5F4_9FABA|nr:hypothetical protein [Stylosanthes scabra]